MSINIRERLNPDGTINLDGRSDSSGGPGEGEDSYELRLQIAPLQVQPYAQATVTIRASKNGQPLAGQEVTLDSDAPSVADVPASVTTNESGIYVFAIIGGAIGDAIISASMVVDGQTINATPLELVVADYDPPVDLNATGAGIVELVLEPRLVYALFPQPERLSHQQQQKDFPGDMGLQLLHFFETAPITWMPRHLQ